jgi:hypothetical protein
MHLFREISGVCKPTKPMSLFHPHTSYFAYFIHRITHTSVFNNCDVRILLEEPSETNLLTIPAVYIVPAFLLFR